MKTYKLKLTQRSALGTPLAADTIFGHICWSMVYHQGQGYLTDFLAEMKSGSPPLILSDPFTEGYLPVPVLPALDGIRRRQFMQQLQQTLDKKTAFDVLKKLNKVKYLPVDVFATLAPIMSMPEIVANLLKSNQEPPSLKSAIVPHNKVDRLGGGTVDGGVFVSEDVFTDSDGYAYELYIQSDKFSAAELKEIFVNAFAGGFGRDKSTGKGCFDIGDIVETPLPAASDANAVMLLGPCVPASGDPVNGLWNLKGKAGKLGGHWAISENPHKKAVLMLQHGSVLYTDSPRPWYGRMVDHVHAELDQVVQYGYAPAIPIAVQHSQNMETVA